jgi:lipid-A-disaccharide synthase
VDCAKQTSRVVLVDYVGLIWSWRGDSIKRASLKNPRSGEGALLYQPANLAWKKNRRFAMQKYITALVYLPFRVDCYRDTTLPREFVGHSVSIEGVF